MLYPISVPKQDSADDLAGYIDEKGNVVVEPQYAAAGYFFEGLGSVCREDGLSGFIDARGEIVIPFAFRGLGQFHDGLCPIGQGVRLGYIRRTGEWQIAPRFAVGGRFSEGVAKVSPDGSAFGHIDSRGAWVIKPRSGRELQFWFSCGVQRGAVGLRPAHR
jgi:hypothetical protein